MTATALAIVQARMSSRRLPGKVLADVAGEPMIGLLLSRLRRASAIDRIVVATSSDPSDDALATWCTREGYAVHRGSLDDVLGRVAEAAAGHEGAVVRITGDCPLVDPEIVDDVVRLLATEPGAAYASNIEPRTYPDGLDVEALRGPVLHQLAAEVEDPPEREHVTAGLWSEPQRWPRTSLVHHPDLGHLRWTVDEPADLEFVRDVVAELADRRYEAGMEEILRTVRTSLPQWSERS